MDSKLIINIIGNSSGDEKVVETSLKTQADFDVRSIENLNKFISNLSKIDLKNSINIISIDDEWADSLDAIKEYPPLVDSHLILIGS